jgi:uncharacterized membrane protein
MLIMLAFYVFVIYFVVSILRFMKAKIRCEEERNAKLDQLIEILRERCSREE